MITFSEITLLIRRLTNWAMITFSMCRAASPVTARTQITLAFSRGKDTTAKGVNTSAMPKALANFVQECTKPRGETARKTLKSMIVVLNSYMAQTGRNRQSWGYLFDIALQSWQLLLAFAYTTNQAQRPLTVDGMDDHTRMKDTNNSDLATILAPIKQGSHHKARLAAETA